MALAGREKSMGFVWFLLSGALILVTGWYVYDEVVGRRTWKTYAAEWEQMESARLDKEIAAATKEINQSEIKKIAMEREKAQYAQESEEAQQAQELLKEKQIALDQANLELQFAKADQDEIFYEWKHALHEGHPHQGFQKEYEALEKKIKALTENQAAKEKEFNEAQEAANKHKSKLGELQSKEGEILKKVAQLDKQLKAVHARGAPIEQYVLPDLGNYGPVIWGTVDRCTSCHIPILKPGFEKNKNPFKTHPQLKEIFSKHPVEDYGCVTCHGGQGEATQISGPAFGPHDYAHGFEHHWLNPLLRGDIMQSTCNKCHYPQWKVDLAPVYTEGKQLFVEAGCINCHTVKGLEWAPKVGPDLAKIKEKVYPEWMLAWARKPTDYLPQTRMPQPPWKDDKEIIQAMAYILDVSEPFNWKFGKFPGGVTEKGKEIFDNVGCIACHSLDGKGGGSGPALDRIAEKTNADWIYNWIQEPKNWSAHFARMPDLRLTTQEASDLTAYLISHGQKPGEDAALRSALADPLNAKAGFKVISDYGCYACHNIKGFESFSKPSVELTNFGRKDKSELAFGDAKIPETWEAWTDAKLKNPQMFLDERSTSYMPKPNISDKERHALVVFLKGQKPERLPERYIAYDPEIEAGRRLVYRYNCQACHVIEGTGQEVAKFIKEPNFLPPHLGTAGARLQTDWMFGFLKDPGKYPKVRPWLNIRMPTFGFTDEEAQALVEYFKKLDKVEDILEQPPDFHISPEYYSAAQQLIGPNNFNCASCHIINGVLPAGGPTVWAPDLAGVHTRIRPEWLNPWIRNPGDLIPGTRMPGYYPEKNSGPKDILAGNDEAQLQALVQYLMTLGKPNAIVRPTLPVSPGDLGPEAGVPKTKPAPAPETGKKAARAE